MGTITMVTAGDSISVVSMDTVETIIECSSPYLLIRSLCFAALHHFAHHCLWTCIFSTPFLKSINVLEFSRYCTVYSYCSGWNQNDQKYAFQILWAWCCCLEKHVSWYKSLKFSWVSSRFCQFQTFIVLSIAFRSKQPISPRFHIRTACLYFVE